MEWHGMSRTLLYGVWSKMKSRCHNPSDKSYPRYGGRGISVCQEWRDSFAAFAAYVGERPDGMTIDRINSAGNYEPGNVRWATPKEQARNTRRTIWVLLDGVRMTLPEAAERRGWKYDLAWSGISKRGKYKGVCRV